MKTLANLLLFLLLISCASNAYHDRAVKNPRYQEGDVTPLLNSRSSRRVNLTPENKALADHDSVPQKSYSTGGAAFGLAVAGVALATKPDYYQKSTLHGRCIFQDGNLKQGLNPQLARPCINVKISLLNPKGEELGQFQTDQTGHFTFYVKKGKSYFLKLVHKHFKLSQKSKGPFEMGQDVTLYAVAK